MCAHEQNELHLSDRATAHQKCWEARSEHCDLTAHVNVVALDPSISIALFQIQLVLPSIERSEIRTSLDQGAAPMDGVRRLTTSR